MLVLQRFNGILSLIIQRDWIPPRPSKCDWLGAQLWKMLVTLHCQYLITTQVKHTKVSFSFHLLHMGG